MSISFFSQVSGSMEPIVISPSGGKDAAFPKSFRTFLKLQNVFHNPDKPIIFSLNQLHGFPVLFFFINILLLIKLPWIFLK